MRNNPPRGSNRLLLLCVVLLAVCAVLLAMVLVRGHPQPSGASGGQTSSGSATADGSGQPAVIPVAEEPIAWDITQLDSYFQAPGPPGETSLQRDERVRQWLQEWDRDFRGRLVEWQGEVRDVRQDGTLVLRCNPNVMTDDTRMKLRPDAAVASGSLQRGQTIRFRARLESYGMTGYELTDGEVLSVSAGPMPTQYPVSAAPPRESVPAIPVPAPPAPATDTQRHRSRVEKGQEGVLEVADLGNVVVMLHDPIWSASKGREVWDVAVPNHTRVLVLGFTGNDESLADVRVLNGEHKGLEGMVPYLWVKFAW